MASDEKNPHNESNPEVVPVETEKEHMERKSTSSHVAPVPVDESPRPVGASGEPAHGVPQLVQPDGHDAEELPPVTAWEKIQTARKGWAAYLKTREFWLVLALGQVISLCLTSTNTFTALLSMRGTSIPAFQTLFNYVLLCLIYTPYTIYKYGFKKWARLLWKDGWRYLILSFFDVEGNYFFVLAYRYTTILSAQLINFWAIVVVVLISLILLRVRYHLTQYLGIIICVGGMGMLIASDHITGVNGGQVPDQLKGDLFALLGATFYGLSNCYEEFMVSKRPLYEVIGQMAFWAIPINGVQSAIFDRAQFRSATWSSEVGGYLTGYTLILALFYTLVPVLFRFSSAAFFNISLLTANFWGVIIGIQVFHYTVHYLYPIAFVLIIIGLMVYFLTESVLGEAKKPWLGEDQKEAVNGIGTAKWKVERAARKAAAEGRPVIEGSPAGGIV